MILPEKVDDKLQFSRRPVQKTSAGGKRRRQSWLCFKDGRPIVGECAAEDENLGMITVWLQLRPQGREKTPAGSVGVKAALTKTLDGIGGDFRICLKPTLF